MVSEDQDYQSEDSQNAGDGGASCTHGHEEQCLMARNDPSECTCECGGKNHGKGRKPISIELQNKILKEILEGTNEVQE